MIGDDYKMNKSNPLMDSGHTPTLDVIGNYIGGAAEERWHEVNQYLEETFKIKPKTTYSRLAIWILTSSYYLYTVNHRADNPILGKAGV